MIKKILMTAIFAIGVTIGLMSCADADGLHNQAASNLHIKFTGFPEDMNGDYAVPGDFNGDSAWEKDISGADVVFKNGEGTTSNPIVLTSTWIKFSLVKTKDSSWTRAWYPAVKGNIEDTGTAGSPMQNFYFDGLAPGSGDITIVVDCSSGVAEIK